MYMKPIKIQEYEKTLIKQAFDKNPFITKEGLAVELGCSVRTIYRLLNTYNIIERKSRKKLSREEECVKYLKSIGYKFS